MGLKPIGSEKLKGQDKINRIMEIARYNESEKNEVNHISTNSFSKKAADGNETQIMQTVLEIKRKTNLKVILQHLKE